MNNTRVPYALRSCVLAALAMVVVAPVLAAPPKYKISIIHMDGWTLEGRHLNNAGQVAGDMCTDDECGLKTFFFDYRNGVEVEIGAGRIYVWNEGLNSKGDIVGGFDNPAEGGEARPYVYMDGVFHELDSDPELDPFVVTTLNDINSSRQAIGDGYFRDGTGLGRPFLWENENITVFPIGPFEGVSARVINNAGQVAGVGQRNSEAHAFLYSDGQFEDLGTVLGADFLYVSHLSGTGILAGGANFPDGTTHAMRSKDGVMVDLGTLGGTESFPVAINNHGHIAGTSRTANGQFRAFLHDGNVMRNLGTLGGTSSSAGHITDNGQVCGTATKGDGSSAGWIFGFAGNKLIDLNSLIASTDPLKAKITIVGAQSCNEFGQVLAVGPDSRFNNRYHWMVLTPVDTTKPAVSAGLTGTKGANGWYKSDVSLVWKTVDAQAPIGSRKGCAAVTVTTDTAGFTSTCVARSLGGTGRKTVTVKRDTTVPTAAISRPAQGTVFNRNQVVRASFACADATAGIQSCAGTVGNGARIDTSKKLTNAMFQVKATDKAGLTRTVTTSYSVK